VWPGQARAGPGRGSAFEWTARAGADRDSASAPCSVVHVDRPTLLLFFPHPPADDIMGESRSELLGWLNDLLQLNYTKVEQCGTGAAYCQVLDSIYGPLPPPPTIFRR
jgi:hypothetical protein